MANEVGDIVANITEDIKTIVRGEIELAKAEIVPAGKAAGVGAGMFGAAGYLGLNAASLLFMAGGAGLGLLFTQLLEWPLLGGLAMGFVLMAVVLLVLAGILALVGKGQLKKVKAPEAAPAEAKATVAAVKTAVDRGVADVKGELPSGEVVARRAAEPLDGATLAAR